MLAPTVLAATDADPMVADSFAGSAFDVVALAASAGGVRALLTLVASLPAGLPAALVLVQHLDPKHRSPRLPVGEATDGQVLRAGALVIAPPDRHLLVQAGLVLRLTSTSLVSCVRPAADVLFASVAAVCARRALAVVLTGSGHDGTAGVRAIKQAGGWVIIQDPASAEFPSMPLAALRTGCVDRVLPLAQIGHEIVRLVQPGGAHD
jgi:two-component system chemotaxis response regulator CheB